jgi:phenylalanyl-tRNA synthetase beta chain
LPTGAGGPRRVGPPLPPAVPFRPMKISVRWLNFYLSGAPVTPEEAERVLTFAGFPIESAERIESGPAAGDTCLDVEVTSNRGDVLSHIGVAREIAAATGRTLLLPKPGEPLEGRLGVWNAPQTAPALAAALAQGHVDGTEAASRVAIDNRVPDVCPMFTARLITGAKVGPSPAWMVALLAAVGQRSINNVVDVTNFVALEYGQPSHVFDARTVAATGGKPTLVVRRASKGEKLALLDGRTLTLAGGEVVVADAGTGDAGPRAISLAGVMGGSLTQVTSATIDVLLEAATWDPVAVRTAARRFAIRTDASYRFERTVDARTIDPAARRAAALIVALSGGTLVPGVVTGGGPVKPAATLTLRPSRCAAVLGLEVPTAELQRILGTHGFDARDDGSGQLRCTIPPHRPDIEREIDLIEEVARTHGLDKLPVHDKLPLRPSAPQTSERAVAELTRVLTGAGFYEAITFTFVPPKHASAFVPAGLKTLAVTDDRRTADPVLRPSALASLLACRRKNQDAGASGDGDGGVRLFELSAVFSEKPGAGPNTRGQGLERRTLALLADACFPAGARSVEQKQAAVRMLRATVESAVRALGGSERRVELAPCAPPVSAFDAGACAEVRVDGRPAGVLGLAAAAVQREHDLAIPVALAELDLDALVALYPPRATVKTLPLFPSIERDLSLIVDESVPWAKIDALVGSRKADRLESWSFVGAYRGQQIGAGKKSVTLRLVFRDPARTLTHDEVTPQVQDLTALAKQELGADLRTV